MSDAASGSVCLGLVGHPVAHSLSPRIHGLFAEQFALGLDYRLFDIEPASFPAFVRATLPDHCQGLNVTVPHKQAAHALCETLTDRAWQAGAVNTLWCDGHVLHGDNTDGIGLVRDLQVNLGLPLPGLRLTIVGAGGAARGIIGPLLEAGVASILLCNRSAERARALAEVFGQAGDLHWSGLDTAPDEPPDLLINATSAGHAGAFPTLPEGSVAPGRTICYDLSYGDAARPFLSWSTGQAAARAVDGLGMLVEQAAESFHTWTGRTPDTAPVLEALGAASTASASRPPPPE